MENPGLRFLADRYVLMNGHKMRDLPFVISKRSEDLLNHVRAAILPLLDQLVTPKLSAGLASTGLLHCRPYPAGL